MEGSTPHPNSQQLDAFADGSLEEGQALGIADHLDACSSCCRAAGERPLDPLLLRLKKALQPHTATSGWSGTGVQQPAELVGHPKLKVLRELGHGGMGIVYLAEHRLMARRVAVKVIRTPLLGHPSVLARFLKEVKAAAQLDHPNIVRAYDAEESGASYLLVMEYVEGTDLAQWVLQQGPLPVADACRYAVQAARGLQHAHAQHLVHRDIKPSNLMLSPQGVVKILDFGVALLNERREQGHLTEVGAAVGTLEYMAPEQAADARLVDGRADVYSLGATLYYLLTGRPPHGGKTALAFLRGHGVREAEQVHEVRRDVPPALAAVVRQMLAREPDHRYPTAAAAADALEPFCTEQPSHPRRSSGWWWLVAAASAAVFGLVLGIILLIRYQDTSGKKQEWQIELRGTPESPPEKPAGPAPPPAPETARAQPGPAVRKVIKPWQPWRPGSDPADALPEKAAPGPEPKFAQADLHHFLRKTLKPMRTQMAQLMLYTEIATTMAREQPGTWMMGEGLTTDGKAYEMTVRSGKWYARSLSKQEVTEKELGPRATVRAVDKLWQLPEKKLVSLGPPEFKVVQRADGMRVLQGRVLCEATAQQWIDYLSLVINLPSAEGDGTRNLFQYYRIHELPSGWLELDLDLGATDPLQYGARIYLQAFLAQPEAGFFRISNEQLWMRKQ